MKIKKIIIFILAMLVIFSVPTSYAKDAVPAANASKTEIEKYIKNNGTDKVSIDRLCKWYNTVGSDTSLVQTVIKGLQNKSKSDINAYCKNKTSDQLRSSIPYSGILKSWMNTVATDSELEKKISEAYSAEQKEAKEKNEKKESLVMGLVMLLAIVLAVGIFVIVPFLISEALKRPVPSPQLRGLIEGVIRVALFVAYVKLISCMEDIKRVFMYHGAEHKSINCVENGKELTVENVRMQTTVHKRCGTSFLLIVMLVSILFFMFIRVDSPILRVVLRLLLIPVIAGVSYEFIRLAGRSDNAVVNLLSKPGLWLQGLTTKEPDDEMIEVGIASVEAVFDWKPYVEEIRREMK